MYLTDENCAESKIVTEYGTFQILVIKHELSPQGDTVALIFGKGDIPLVRIHSECLTGDVFHSQKCDCYAQLQLSLKLISESGYGILIYLRQEGRGIGLFNKIKSYDLQSKGYDTVDANIALGFLPDNRKYTVATDILIALGVNRLRLITNNPDKVKQVSTEGITVIETVPCITTPNEHNEFYLTTKKDRMQHLL